MHARSAAPRLPGLALAGLLVFAACDSPTAVPSADRAGVQAVQRTASAATNACVAWDAQPATIATSVTFSTSPGGGFAAGETITASAGPPVSNTPAPAGITMTIDGSVVDTDGFPGTLEHTFGPGTSTPTTIEIETDNLSDVRWTFTCGEPVVQVAVDVKPGSAVNPVNPASRGKLPVAVLTDGGFDASRVDPATVTLGDGAPPEAAVALRGRGRPMASLRDVDGDGDRDLLLHFETRELVANGDLDRATTSLQLDGETRAGTAIRGSDAVQPVGGGRP